MPTLAAGEVVGEKFRVGSVIGRGGMSVVYEAQHVQLGQRVAVKVLATPSSATKGAFDRALVEAQATARLTSEHVVRVFDVGTTKAGDAYVVMEKLSGSDLARELRNGGMPIADAVKIVLQACHALAEAHASGIVHRDLKPSNLFLATRPDKTVVVKVLDFGLARADSRTLKGRQLSTMPRMAGSPGYASPEQLGTASDVDARADVWGLGIVLYELITGKRPFQAANLTDALIAASTLPMPAMVSPHGAVPPAFEKIVQRCLEKDRENRFASVLDLAEALTPFAPPQFMHYAQRIRDVGGRNGMNSAGTIPVTVHDASPTIHDMSPSMTVTETFSSDVGLSVKEPDTEVGVTNQAPLVVASVVPAYRTAMRLVVAGGVAVALLLILVAGRTINRASAATPAARGAAAMPLPPRSLGPLPPLAGQNTSPRTGDVTDPGDVTPASPTPTATATATIPTKVDPPAPPVVVAAVAPAPPPPVTPPAPPRLTPTPVRNPQGRPAPAKPAPAPQPAKVGGPAGAPTGNPMTYR
jgi:serine/threonine-protein kinase